MGILTMGLWTKMLGGSWFTGIRRRILTIRKRAELVFGSTSDSENWRGGLNFSSSILLGIAFYILTRGVFRDSLVI